MIGNSSYFFDALRDHPGFLKNNTIKNINNNNNNNNDNNNNNNNNSNNKINNINNNNDNSNLKMEECINSMKLIFPSYGAGFLQACLLVRKNL